MLINFEGIEEYSMAIHKKNEIKTEVLGQQVVDFIDSGVLDKLITAHPKYWIPSNKIFLLKERKGHYFVNNIEVNEENFKKVIKQMENEV